MQPKQRLARAAACAALVCAGTPAPALAQSSAPGSAQEAPAASPADLEQARENYEKYCWQCHGLTGDGMGPVGKTLDPPPRDFTKGEFKFGNTDRDLFDVISNGAAPRGGNGVMGGWSETISEPERWGLVRFLRSLKK
jgi:mono/diheme cytochrome c family protein